MRFLPHWQHKPHTTLHEAERTFSAIFDIRFALSDNLYQFIRPRRVTGLVRRLVWQAGLEPLTRQMTSTTNGQLRTFNDSATGVKSNKTAQQLMGLCKARLW